MFTYYVPFIAYILALPVMLLTLRKVEYGIIYFITIVPVMALVKRMSLFPAGHNFADFMLMAMIIGWLLNSARDDNKLFVSSPMNTGVALMMVGSTLSLLWGYLTPIPVEDVNYLRLTTWKNFMILPALYFIGLNNVRRKDTVQWLIGCMMLTLVACAFNFYSSFRWVRSYNYSHDIRLSGPFTNLGPNEMGVFFSMYTLFLFGMAYYTDNRKIRYLLYAVCAINMYPILYSYSRVTYLSVLFGLTVLGIVKDRRILAVLAVLVVLYGTFLPHSVVQRIDMTFVEKEDASDKMLDLRAMDIGGVTVDSVGRKFMWEMAVDYFKSSPLLGTGFDTFRHKEGFITHGMYFRILAEQGAAGFLIHLIFYSMVISQAYKLHKKSETNLGKGVGLGFLLAAVAHLVGNVSGDQSLYYNIMAIFWLFLGIVARMNVVEMQGDEPLAALAATRDAEDLDIKDVLPGVP